VYASAQNNYEPSAARRPGTPYFFLVPDAYPTNRPFFLFLIRKDTWQNVIFIANDINKMPPK